MHNALDGPLGRDLGNDSCDRLFVARIDATDLDFGARVFKPAHDVGGLGLSRAGPRQEHKVPTAALEHPCRQTSPETAQAADEEIGRFGGEADGLVGLANLKEGGEWLAKGDLDRPTGGERGLGIEENRLTLTLLSPYFILRTSAPVSVMASRA